MRGSGFFALGMATVAAVWWAHGKGFVPAPARDWNLAGIEWPSSESETEEEDAIVVVLVPDAESVAAVREAVSAHRVVAASDEAFAVREGRVVASSREAAGELIARAGWADAPIEIVTTVARGPVRPQRAAPRGDPAAQEAARERRAELSELSKKPELTLPEAMRALELME